MKVLVLGAAGIVANAVLADLIRFNLAEEIVLADINTARCEERLSALRPPKGRVERVDAADPESVAAAARGCDVLLNCAQYYFNLPVMEGALQAGVHYADLGGLFHTTRQQQALDDRFRAAGLTALLCMGSAAGITNVMARYAVDRLDRAERMRVRVASALIGDTSRLPLLAVPYSLQTILDEMTMRPVVWAGDYREEEPLTGREPVNLPAGATCDVYWTLHSELLTLPQSFPSLGYCDFKVGFPDRLMQALRVLLEVGLASEQPLHLAGAAVPRRQMLSALLAQAPPPPPAGPAAAPVERVGNLWVEVDGERGGRPVRIRVESPYRGGPRAQVAGYATGVPLAIAAPAVAGRGPGAAGPGALGPGVRVPEAAVDPEWFFDELGKREIAVRVLEATAWDPKSDLGGL